MNLPIEKRVFELLKHYDCVIITGLGGFILNHRSAYVNDITKTIYPPSKYISFNKNLCQNDGLLANYLTEIENISYDEACLAIMRFSRKAKLKLQNQQTVNFKNIGTLYCQQEGKIEFSANESFNFNQDSYGFKSFQLKSIKREPKKSSLGFVSAAAIVLLICISVFSLNNNVKNVLLFNLNPLNVSNYTPRGFDTKNDSFGQETPGIYNVQVSKVDPDLYKINGTDYHIATKKCFKEGFGRDVQIKIWKDSKDKLRREVCFLNFQETEYSDCYKITQVYNEMSAGSNKIMVMLKNGRMKEALFVFEETYIDPYVIANSEPDQDYNNDSDSLLFKDIPTRFKEAIQSISTPQELQKNTITIDNSESIPIEPKLNTNSSDLEKSFHIIVGSFSDKKNARALIKQLKKRGFQNAKILGLNERGLTRVTVASFYTQEEADQELINIRLKLSSAWVLANE